MPADDDPIEDLQRAGATAGAAGARAVEAALRSRQQQAQQQDREATRQAQRPPGDHESGFGRQVGGYAEDDPGPLTEDGYHATRTVSLDDPDTWGSRDESVTEAQQWTLQKAGIEMPGTKGEASKLIRDMYDSPEARAERHNTMEAAGVALEPRQAAMAADKMNATDPALAAASGSKRRVQQRRSAKIPQRERGR